MPQRLPLTLAAVAPVELVEPTVVVVGVLDAVGVLGVSGAV